MISVIAAKYLGDHKIHLRFNDGIEGVADLGDCDWKGMLAPLENQQFFRYFAVDRGTLVWPNDADIAPEFFYKKVTGRYPDEHAVEH